MYCTVCGAANNDVNRFCMKCGAGLQGLPRPVMADTTDYSLGGLIPYRNSNALISYYVGLFSFFPFVGLIMGIVAIVLGVRGLKLAGAQPEVKGKTHAWVGIILGGLFGAMNLAMVIFFISVAF